jgi:hypothetical protein
VVGILFIRPAVEGWGINVASPGRRLAAVETSIVKPSYGATNWVS